MYDGDLHAVDWGEGPWALVTPVKAIRVGVGLKKQEHICTYFDITIVFFIL